MNSQDNHNDAPDSWEQNDVGENDSVSQMAKPFTNLNVHAAAFVPGQNIHAKEFVPTFMPPASDTGKYSFCTHII